MIFSRREIGVVSVNRGLRCDPGVSCPRSNASSYSCRMEAQENEPSCSIERSLEVLGERWTLLILRSAFLGTTRFADFRSTLGIAPNLLSARLRTLVAAGVLEPQQYREPGSRTRVSYHLTESGKQLRLILAALQQWGDEHRPRPAGPSAVRRSRSTAAPCTSPSSTTPAPRSPSRTSRCCPPPRATNPRPSEPFRRRPPGQVEWTREAPWPRRRDRAADPELSRRRS